MEPDVLKLGNQSLVLIPLSVRKQIALAKVIIGIISESQGFEGKPDVGKMFNLSLDSSLDILKIVFNLTDAQLDEITSIEEVRIAIKAIQTKYPFSELLKMSTSLLQETNQSTQGKVEVGSTDLAMTKSPKV